jgi:hypothetical protein
MYVIGRLSGQDSKSVPQDVGLACYSEPRETGRFRQLLNPWQGNAHDTAKRLNLQEVFPNPVLQPLSRIRREPDIPRGRLPGNLLKLCEGVRQ